MTKTNLKWNRKVYFKVKWMTETEWHIYRRNLGFTTCLFLEAAYRPSKARNLPFDIKLKEPNPVSIVYGQNAIALHAFKYGN